MPSQAPAAVEEQPDTPAVQPAVTVERRAGGREHQEATVRGPALGRKTEQAVEDGCGRLGDSDVDTAAFGAMS